MAQDFQAAFPFRESTTSLNDADLHGVALAAIQGLNRKVENSEREKAALHDQNEDLKERVAALESIVGRLISEGEQK